MASQSAQEYRQMEEKMEEVISTLDRRRKHNLAAIARENGFPPQRFRARYNGRDSRSTRQPGNKKLTDEQEFAVYSHIKRMDKSGIKTRVKALPTIANQVLARNHEGESPPPTVGKHWGARFAERHNIESVKQKPIEPDRQAAHDPETITWWFGEYKRVVREYGILPEDTWNFDEIGVRIGVGKDQLVLTFDTKKEGKRYWASSLTNRESATVIESCSAAGAYIDPLIILKGNEAAQHQTRWFAGNNWGNDYTIAFSESSYTNDELAMVYIKHFNRLSARTQRGVWRLLIFDGHESHTTADFIQYCDSNKIICLGLPSHLTHIFQPLDVGVFQAWKHWHGQTVDYAVRTGCKDFNRIEFLHGLHRIRMQTFKESTIKSAFKKTGLWPINPAIILGQLRPRESTPPRDRARSPPDFWRTPRTIRSINRFHDALRNGEYKGICKDSHKAAWVIFNRGVNSALQAGAQAQQQLAEIEAVQHARKSRQSAKRTVLQKGGVLQASHARWIASKKTTAQKAKEKLQLIARSEALEKKQEAQSHTLRKEIHGAKGLKFLQLELPNRQ